MVVTLTGVVFLLEGLETRVSDRWCLLSDKQRPPKMIQILLFSHALHYVTLRLKHKTMHANRNGKFVATAVLVVQSIFQAWGILIREDLNVSLPDAMLPYML